MSTARAADVTGDVVDKVYRDMAAYWSSRKIMGLLLYPRGQDPAVHRGAFAKRNPFTGQQTEEEGEREVRYLEHI